MLSHYDLVVTENGYSFETEHGRTYFLSFLLYPLINDNPNCSLFMFNIELLDNDVKAQADKRIELTIRYALNKFFQENNDALIVILDTIDGKHHARKRLFEKWYRNANSFDIEKLDVQCHTDEMDIIASLLVAKNNPFNHEIKDSFIDLTNQNFYS